MQTFSFNPPMEWIEEGNWLLAVISSEAMNSFFNITDEINKFFLSTSCYWTPEDNEKLINKLNKLLRLRSETNIELHVKKCWKKRHPYRNRNQWIKFIRS